MAFRHSGIRAFRVVLVIGLLPVLGRSLADVKVETIDYRGWKGSYRVTNGTVELVFVPQIGRVMRYAFVGGRNVLWENLALMGKTVDQKNPGKEWVNFGGDKLWPAPQSRWNWPPNPVLDAGDHEVISSPGGRLLIMGEPSEKDGIKFSRMIVMAPTGTEVRFFNSMTNIKREGDVEWSVWEVAQVDEPDRAVMPADPRNPRDGHYSYKDNPPAAAQISRTGRIVRFTRGKEKGAKIGAASPEGWLTSEKEGVRFRVWAKYPLSGKYPHDGNAQEIWSNPDPLKYMELELLSPIVTLKPGKTYTFETRWELEKF